MPELIKYTQLQYPVSVLKAVIIADIIDAMIIAGIYPKPSGKKITGPE